MLIFCLFASLSYIGLQTTDNKFINIHYKDTIFFYKKAINQIKIYDCFFY